MKDRNHDVLRDLATLKALFQLRTIEMILREQPSRKPSPTVKKERG